MYVLGGNFPFGKTSKMFNQASQTPKNQEVYVLMECLTVRNILQQKVTLTVYVKVQ